jgi:hypothetical protein
MLKWAETTSMWCNAWLWSTGCTHNWRPGKWWFMDLLGIMWIKQCHKLINHPWLGTVAYTTCKHGDWGIMALSYPHYAHDEISQHLCNHLNPNPYLSSKTASSAAQL